MVEAIIFYMFTKSNFKTALVYCYYNIQIQIWSQNDGCSSQIYDMKSRNIDYQGYKDIDGHLCERQTFSVFEYRIIIWWVPVQIIIWDSDRQILYLQGKLLRMIFWMRNEFIVGETRKTIDHKNKKQVKDIQSVRREMNQFIVQEKSLKTCEYII